MKPVDRLLAGVPKIERPLLEVDAAEIGIDFKVVWQRPTTAQWYVLGEDVADLMKQDPALVYQLALDIATLAVCHQGPDLGDVPRATFYKALSERNPDLWGWLLAKHAELMPACSRIAAAQKLLAQMATENTPEDEENPTAARALESASSESSPAPASSTDTPIPPNSERLRPMSSPTASNGGSTTRSRKKKP